MLRNPRLHVAWCRVGSSPRYGVFTLFLANAKRSQPRSGIFRKVGTTPIIDSIYQGSLTDTVRTAWENCSPDVPPPLGGV